ncbi:hypothetical protein OIDMADRAFT_18039 [Oidiodendron maius Zn]|uniref:Uncharacterized protein n=1 Tax=Oidiodendron maius (strain Zn) TaxID=913774 RepID=A0A0C3HNB0_OIDMZ|nr:hypothetical protein OIDMADRAFT_18039 [Oidiodendron maius Zn]
MSGQCQGHPEITSTSTSKRKKDSYQSDSITIVIDAMSVCGLNKDLMSSALDLCPAAPTPSVQYRCLNIQDDRD